MIFLFGLLTVVCSGGFCAYLPEDATLNFTGFASKYGLKFEEHNVVTKDGYVLMLFRIPGDRTRPVLLMHGLVDSADTFITRGNSSIVAYLARSGYDVWVGNNRGNRYSRRHTYLNPDVDKEFWNFSFHEIALYDLSAKIDYILNNTGQTRLSCIGHSQGNTLFYVLGSMMTEYNDKIKVIIALAPISYLYYLKGPTKFIVRIWPLVSNILSIAGREEIVGDKTWERNLFKTMCSQDGAYEICGKRAIFPVAGFDTEELEPAFLPIAVSHYPSGSSRKTITHLLQSGLKRKFAQMDYGEAMNLVVYNSSLPPDYDLSKVTMRVALIAGANDGMCALKDVKTLMHRLPNVVQYLVLDRRETNHLDFVWGRNIHRYLLPHIYSLLDRFKD